MSRDSRVNSYPQELVSSLGQGSLSVLLSQILKQWELQWWHQHLLLPLSWCSSSRLLPQAPLWIAQEFRSIIYTVCTQLFVNWLASYMHLTCTLWTWERKQLGRCEIKKTCILAPMLIYFACIIYIILSLSLSLPLSHLSDGKESQQVTGVIIMFPHKLGP